MPELASRCRQRYAILTANQHHPQKECLQKKNDYYYYDTEQMLLY